MARARTSSLPKTQSRRDSRHRWDSSDVAAVAAHVISSLREEHEDPPELFCDPVSKAMMEDPVVIETGYVFDRSSVFNASGKFRFENGCR